MAGLDSAPPVGGLEGSPNLQNLLRVAGGMGGDHEEGLLAGNGTGEEGMISGPAARIIVEIFDVFEGLCAHGIEGGESFVQAPVAAGWLGHGGCFDGAGAVSSAGGNFGFTGWMGRIGGELGDAEAGEEVLLGEDHVLDAFEDGPGWIGRVLGRRLARSQRVVDSSQRSFEGVAAIVQGRKQRLLFRGEHGISGRWRLGDLAPM